MKPDLDFLAASIDDTAPGCAIAILNGGETFSQAHGLAVLEHDVTMTPTTAVYMGSVSKQFVAMAALMLVEEGALALDQPVTELLPDLPDYCAEITVRHLLTHTSGLRDFLSLGYLAGLSSDHVFTEAGSLALIRRQAALNFAPGSRYSYSNSGYFLVDLIITALAGKPLDAFARERIFAPLGMTATRFQHDHSALVPKKATGYVRRGEAWHVANAMLDVVGGGGLYATAEDMLAWMRNLQDPQVGGEALRQMRIPGRLRDGTPIPYGMGLSPGRHAGMDVVEHGGGLAGYRTHLLWIPDRTFAVSVLCNSGQASPQVIAGQIADACLAGRASPQAPPAEPPTALGEAEAKALAGAYRSDGGDYLILSARDGRLWWGPEEIRVSRSREGSIARLPDLLALRFDDASPAGWVETTQFGAAPERRHRVSRDPDFESRAADYFGRYESRELRAAWTIEQSSEGVQLRRGDAVPLRLTSAGPDRLRLRDGSGELVFERDGDNRVTAFTLNSPRARGIGFVRASADRA